MVSMDASGSAALLALPAGTPVRINVGAGSKVLDGYLSLGLEDHHDIKADVRRIPLADNTADEMIVIHVLEHLARWDAPAALQEWRRVLKPGGLLVIEQPDLIKCCRNIIAGAVPRDGLLGLYGDPVGRDELMMHRWGWSVEELRGELKAAGFYKVRERKPVFHGKRIHRDMRLEARK